MKSHSRGWKMWQMQDLRTHSCDSSIEWEQVWWQILCVNQTGPQDMPTRSKMWFWLCLWGCFWINSKLTFESVDHLPSLMWVGHIQSIEDLNRTKRQSKKQFLLCCLGWDTALLQPSYSYLDPVFSWVLSLLAFRVELKSLTLLGHSDQTSTTHKLS